MKSMIIEAINGNSESLYTLIQNHNKTLYKIAFCYVHNTEDALDIVQETVYKALVSIKTLKKPEYFYTWLTRITINCAINHSKKLKRILPTETLDFNISLNNLHGHENILDLRIALEKLNTKYKTVIILKYFNGFSLQEISDILNLPLSTVKSHVYRGLKKLKIDLEEVDLIE